MPPHPIPPSPIHVDDISSQPVEDILSSPSGFLTPPCPILTQESVVELSPSESLPSMIIRIKARHRMNKLPVRLQPYQVTTYGAHSAECSLTIKEATLLDIFWNEYEANDPSLAKFCTVIPAIKMRQLLLNEWLDTKAMDYWFKILATRVRGAHFFHSSPAV
ncbi:hypothetical protein MRB53_026925 [Persea americana]|uniref:Uncharacterized protein n=1 Tax=Persea americana TaxID=3435 RepID=A0ACC2LJM6_PERAE|nr:hypothetical protein MRB53_026925 [Persea americana]